MNAPVNLDTLPNPLFKQIVSRLQVKDGLRLTLVSKTMIKRMHHVNAQHLFRINDAGCRRNVKQCRLCFNQFSKFQAFLNPLMQQFELIPNSERALLSKKIVQLNDMLSSYEQLLAHSSETGIFPFDS